MMTTTFNKPVFADQVITGLVSMLNQGGMLYAQVPETLEQVMREGLWKRRTVHLLGDQVVTFKRFVQFVKAERPAGLGMDPVELRKLVDSDLRVLDAYDQAIGSDKTRDAVVDNSNNNAARPTGTTAQQALRRLRKDRQDLHERVLAGELSPHAAMVIAGFRPQTVTVRPTVDGFARAAQRHLNVAELHALAQTLDEP
jgi:hypothetical protein